MLGCLLSKRTAILPRFLAVRRMSSFGDHCPLVISPAQLRQIQGDGVAVLDATWHMPNVPRNPHKEFIAKHIPGARFLGLDEVASPHDLGLKHMMPSGEVFAKYCGKAGITPSSHVVIYDSHGIFSSPRALFMFRAFGHDRSSILDGGLPAWEAHGGPVEAGEPSEIPETNYPVPTLNEDVIRSYEQIVTNTAFNPDDEPIAELVVDARPRGRYTGAQPEPRPGLSSGHMPFARSLPFTTLLDAHQYTPAGASEPVSYTTIKSNAGLHEALEKAVGPAYAEAVLKGERGAVASCGSGMTAGVIWLALKLMGAERVALYDESWTGYALREGSKIEKGE
ncbi:hypothetical protein NM688_g4151 [Phlebia brevispora]|uniref:Uncharacterized protein n=1 Tax=Phlebia brevispora TaxID=194682 RepID=A0ACC1T3W1_9APHY|nr:hypothetical protein NM688_g4151 [Phlebia brevispora]